MSNFIKLVQMFSRSDNCKSGLFFGGWGGGEKAGR